MTVEELWDQTWRSISANDMTDFEFIPAVNLTTEKIFTYLWKRKSNLVTDLFAMNYFEPMADAAQNFLLDGEAEPLLAVRTLPSAFRGLAERPFIEGASVHLQPITEELRIQLARTTETDPTHYELKGTKLYIWPLPAKRAVVRGSYFKHPGKVAAYTDDIPFNGTLDLAYMAIVLTLLEAGLAADLTALLDREVGELLEVRDYHTPPRTVIKDF
jgi:hypothetical protein